MMMRIDQGYAEDVTSPYSTGWLIFHGSDY
jgi:hypothetical protein